jgi:TP901 family phage tail tape measure protein
MRVFLRLDYDGGRLTSGLNQAQGAMRRFTSSARTGLTALSAQMSRLHAAIGGFSTITRLAGGYFGMQGLRQVMQANLEFERTLLEAKQLAGMSNSQAAQMRRDAVEISKLYTASPLETAGAMQKLANAGMKFEAIKGTIQESARAATAFRSSVEDIANMDFDLQEKLGIDPARIKEVHNLLYYHSKAGRFEAKSMSQFAPVYLNELKQWGIRGVEGANFGGALLQTLQKVAPASEPGETVTILKHGLSHLAAPRTSKHLREMGIDVRKYAPGGKFGSVDDLLDLVETMKAKGLQDTFKAGKVFHEELTRKFWLQLMEDADAIRAGMAEGRKAMLEDMVGRDVAEIMGSDFGKVQKSMNALQRGELSKPGSKGTSVMARLFEYATEHPLQALMGGGGLFLAGRMAWNRYRGGGGGGGALGGLAGAAGVQRVFVVNFPGMGGSGVLSGGKDPFGLGGGGAAGGATRGLSRLGRGLAGAKGAFKIGLPLALLMGGVEAFNTWSDDSLSAEAKKTEYSRIAGGTAGGIAGASIGAGIGALVGGVGAIPGALIGGWLGQWLGEKAGQAAGEKIFKVENKIVLDGREIAQSVNEFNELQGARE